MARVVAAAAIPRLAHAARTLQRPLAVRITHHVPDWAGSTTALHLSAPASDRSDAALAVVSTAPLTATATIAPRVTPTTAGTAVITATIAASTSLVTASASPTATLALSDRPSSPHVATDGTYQGRITGFDRRTVYIWQSGRLLALPLGPASTLTSGGAPITVWRLAIGELVTARVSGGQVTTLLAQRLPTAPTATPRAAASHVQAQPIHALSMNAPSSDTWTQTNGSFMGVYGLIVDPNDPNHLRIGSNTVLYEGQRANGAVTWTPRSGGRRVDGRRPGDLGPALPRQRRGGGLQHGRRAELDHRQQQLAVRAHRDRGCERQHGAGRYLYR